MTKKDDDMMGMILLGVIVVGAWFLISGSAMSVSISTTCKDGALRCDQGVADICVDGVWKSTGFPC